ncbi:MAG: biopolymer transporter ExbD [Spirochaetales bacterium]|nr:biopolymer transporter ExbD [Spirochaetales bacterium]
MNILRKRKADHEIPSSSLSDIAFLLIIFFMVTSVFILREGLVTILPKTTSEPVTVESKDLLKIGIEPNGLVVVDGREYEIETLHDVLLPMKDDGNKVAKIRIHPQTAYKDVVFVVGELQSAGLTRLSIKKKELHD